MLGCPGALCQEIIDDAHQGDRLGCDVVSVSVDQSTDAHDVSDGQGMI